MVIDDAVRRYRNGGCFAMAEALHRLTGFPVRCIDFGSCTHAFVMSPAQEVLDIHGRMPWNEFLEFLVADGTLPAHALVPGCINAQAIPEPVPVLWTHLGYRKPSETAVKNAMTVARRHPNLAGKLYP